MADVVPRDGLAPSTGGPIATAVSPGARSGRFTCSGWRFATPTGRWVPAPRWASRRGRP